MAEKGFTYEQILQAILALPEERRKDTAAIFDNNSGEFLEVTSVRCANERDDDVLDPGHLILSIN